MAKSKEGKSVKIRILQAGKNKPMPRAHGLELEGLCRGNGVEVQRKEVVGPCTRMSYQGSGAERCCQFLGEDRPDLISDVYSST